MQCFTCTGTYCVAVTLKSVSSLSCVLDTILNHELYLLFCKIPLLPLLHCMFLTFLLRLITRIGSKCYGLINLIHVLSFSDISFKYCTLYCHFSLIFVTLHVLVFLFYKKKMLWYILLSSSTRTNMYEWHFFLQNGIKKIFF